MHKLSAEGKSLAVWDIASRGLGDSLILGSLSVDQSGFLYMSEAYNDRVVKFDPNSGVVVGRWGGDEFLVLLTQADEASASQKAEELANRHLPKLPGDERLRIDLSVGWATHHTNSEFPKTLAEADARMYEMKLSRKKERATQERDLGRL